jgi:hypothetical protein
VFPGSGNGRPRQIDEINSEGQKLLLGWEASIATAACTSQQRSRETEGNQISN